MRNNSWPYWWLRSGPIVYKSLSAEVALTATITKAPAKFLRALQFTTPYMLPGIVRVKALVASVALTADLVALPVIIKIMTATVALTGSLFKQIQKALAGSTTLSAALTKLRTLVLAASATTFGRLFSPLIPVSYDDIFYQVREYLLYFNAITRTRMISPVKLLEYLDQLGSGVNTDDAQNTATAYTGLLSLVIGQDGISGDIYGVGDLTFIDAMAQQTTNIMTAFSPNTFLASFYYSLMNSLNKVLQSEGGSNYTDLDTYLTYENGIAGIYTYNVAPQVALLQWIYNQQQGARLMQPLNVFAPQTAFGTCAVGASAAITFTPGRTIRTVNNAGSSLQGYTPSKGLNSKTTTAINGTCAATATADGWDSSGTPQTGRLWTATLDNSTLNSVVTWTPAHAGDRISQVTAVAGTGTATLGGFALNSVIERTI